MRLEAVHPRRSSPQRQNPNKAPGWDLSGRSPGPGPSPTQGEQSAPEELRRREGRLTFDGNHYQTLIPNQGSSASEGPSAAFSFQGAFMGGGKGRPPHPGLGKGPHDMPL